MLIITVSPNNYFTTQRLIIKYLLLPHNILKTRKVAFYIRIRQTNKTFIKRTDMRLWPRIMQCNNGLVIGIHTGFLWLIRCKQV